MVGLLLGGHKACLAQAESMATKPLVVVAFSGYDELFADVEMIGKLAGNDDLAKGLEMTLTMMTQGKGLKGLDKSRPWGVTVQTNGQEFPVFGFVPVEDLKQLLDSVGPLLGEVEETDGGVYEVQTQARPVFIKQQGQWAFIANSADGFAEMPEDPVSLLSGLHSKYLLAVRAWVNHIPDPLRQMFVAQLEMGAQAGLQQNPGESDEEYAVRTQVTRRMIEQMRTAVNELEDLLVGLNIDREAGTAQLDFAVRALEGTTTADQFAAVTEGKTNFAGFHKPEAALTGIWTGKLAEADIAQAKASLAQVQLKAIEELDKQGLPEEKADKAKEILTDLLAVFEESIEQGNVDGAFAVAMDGETLNVSGGGYLSDGPKLEAVIKELVAVAKEEDEKVADVVKLDVGSHEGVNLHAISIPIPEDADNREAAVELLGENVDIVLGIGPEAVYAAAGQDAMETLKQGITSSKEQAGKEVPPMQMSLAAGPIAEFIAKFGEEETKPVAAMLAVTLQQVEGKDHIKITSVPIPRGVKVEILIESGIVKLIGSLTQMQGGGPGGPGAMPGGPGS
jgi:hypothetical protein